MATKAASIAYRVFDVGIEHNVKSFTAVWKDVPSSDGKKPKKFQSITAALPDTVLAYADIVCICDADEAAYCKALSWQSKSRDMHFMEAKKERPDGAAFISVLRIFWYHNGTHGKINNNIGFADLLSVTTLPDAVKSKLIAEGNKGVQEAFTLMRKIKSIHMAKGATGSHLAARMFMTMDRSVGRTIVSGLVDGRNFNWDAGAPGNRNRTHVWKEEIHGKVMDAAWKLHLDRKASDSSMDDLAALADGIHSAEDAIAPHKDARSGEICEFTYVSETGMSRKGYRSPDGSELRSGDRDFFKVQKEFFEQEKQKGEQNG